MAEEIKKCLVCAMEVNHRFRDCSSPICECGCLYEIKGETPLEFKDYPQWFRYVSSKSANKFNGNRVRERNLK